MLGGLFRGWARSRYRKEAEKTLRHLRDLDDKSIGLVLAIAAHQRNALTETGADMRDLSALARDAPMYQHELAKGVSVLARKKRPHDALGLQIWVHSLRAVADPGLRDLGAAIWTELARGRPHVAEARRLVKKETDFDLDIAMAGEIPREFVDAAPD